MTNTITLKDFIVKLNSAQTKEQIDWIWEEVCELTSNTYQNDFDIDVTDKKNRKLKFEDDINEFEDMKSRFNMTAKQKKKRDKKQYESKSTIFKMRFKLGAFEAARKELYALYPYLDNTLIDAYLVEAITKAVAKDQIDLESYNENQLSAYIKASAVGFARNSLKEEIATRSEFKPVGGQYTLDKLDYQSEYTKIEDYDYTFQKHLNKIGLHNILSEQQLEVYELIAADYKQTEVAEKLGCTQQNVSKLLNAANERIKKQHLDFMTFNKLVNDKLETYKLMKAYVDQVNDIRQYDYQNTFDYYGKTKDFIMMYYAQYKPDDIRHYNIIDVITDNLKKNEYGLFDAVVTNQFVAKRNKDRFVNCINRIFIKELQKTREVTGAIYKNLVEYYHKDYDSFIGLIKIS